MSRYRCFITRSLALTDNGELEFVQLRARSATDAARLALAVTGAMSVVEVVRLEDCRA